MPSPETLLLVAEHKIAELLGARADKRLEASGVCARGDFLYVIFDNAPHIARIQKSIAPGHPGHRLLRHRAESVGFEDVTFDERAGRFLVIIEAAPHGDGYRPVIEEYDEDFRFLERRWVELDLDSANKGVEGVSWVRRGNHDYVLGLCEGNRCRSGKAGRKPGGGRIHVFRRGKKRWKHHDLLKLPRSVLFEDYAGLRVEGDRIAVVSQRSSALWIGRLAKDKLAFEGEGTTYLFPRTKKNEPAYCNIEGVAWHGERRVVVVSDRCKPQSQPRRCARKDQSIHVFEIPR